MTEHNDTKSAPARRAGAEPAPPHTPRPFPPPEMLFQVEVWGRDLGWFTAAWTLTRMSADDIAADWLSCRDGLYTRAQVWRNGAMAAEYADPLAADPLRRGRHSESPEPELG